MQGDRVRFSSPCRSVVREPGTVTRCYRVSEPFAHVVLDNGQEWLARFYDLDKIKVLSQP